MHSLQKKIICLVFFCFFILPLIAQPHRSSLEAPFVQKADPQTASLITLKLKNMDILEVFNILSEKGNLNIIAGNNVRGRVTLFLKDVAVWDAFRFIIELNALAYIEENNIIRVFTEHEYEAIYGKKFHKKTQLKIYKINHADIALLKNTIEGIKSQIGRVMIDENSNALLVIDNQDNLIHIEETIKILDKPLINRVYNLTYTSPKDIEPHIKEILSSRGSIQIDVKTNKILVSDIEAYIDQVERIIFEYDKKPFLVTEIFELQYANYDEIKEKLEPEITEEIGSIKADERTSKIVITDTPEKIEKLKKIIQALDEKSMEVIIEAKILQIRLSDEYRFGINWQQIITEFKGRNLNFNFSQVFSQITDNTLSDTAPFDARKTGGRIVATGIAEGGQDGMGNPYEIIVDVLKQLGDVKIISSPR
ncbi:secretin N-terminal domain-containing protein, partial [Chlamydiota bacterium]